MEEEDLLESIGVGILTSVVYDAIKHGKDQIKPGLWGFIVETKDEFSANHSGTDEILEKFFFNESIATVVDNYRNKGTEIDFEELLIIFQRICKEFSFNSEPRKTLRDFFDYLEEKISSNKKIYDKIILRYSQDTNRKIGTTLEIVLEIKDELKESKNNEKKAATKLSQKPKYFKGTTKHFVGRINEIQGVTSSLERSSKISIVGEGGLGKTSLAIEIIHSTENDFELIIPFYFVSDFSYEHFLLEISKRIGLDSKEFIKNSLDHRLEIVMNELSKQKRVLILADNYEMIVSKIKDKRVEDAVKINNFLESVPDNTSIILTSRRKDNLTGEVLINLEGLSNEEGYDLFCELAKKNLKNQCEDNVISDKIKSIVKKVGGHPLAIEILARSYRGEGIEELSSMFDSLGIGVQNPKSIDERLRSLDACFEYSINLLSEKLEQFLLQITLFSSPFPSRLTSDVFSIEERDLDELYEHSLIQRIEKDEFGELEREFWLYDFHPVIHEFLKKKLDKEGLEKNLSEELALTSGEIMSDRRMYLDTEKRDQAIRNFLLQVKNESNDLEQFSELITNQNVKSQYFGLMGDFFHQAGLLKKAKETYDKIFQIVSFNKFPENLLPILGNYSLLLSKLESYDEAINYQKQLAEVFENKNDDEKCGIAYDNIGLMYYRIGNKIEAENFCNKSIEKLKNTENKSSLANTYLNLGNVIRQSNPDESLKLINNAKEIFVTTNDSRRIAICYNDLAMTYSIKNNLEESLKNLTEALEIYEKIHDERGIAQTYLNFVTVYNKNNDGVNMQKYISKCLPMFEKLQDIRGMIECHFQMGNRFSTDRKMNDAMSSYQTAYSLAESIGNMHQIGRIGIIMGGICAGTNHHPAAFSYLKKSLDIFKNLQDEHQLETCKMSFRILVECLKASLMNNQKNNNQEGIKKDYELLMKTYSELDQKEEMQKLQDSIDIIKDNEDTF